MALFTTYAVPDALGMQTLVGSVYHEVDHIAIDSRSGALGQRSAFIALISASDNGHHYIPNAYDHGVRVFIVSEYYSEWSAYSDACFIQVEDTLKSLQSFASYRRKLSPAKVVAITGSNGKTVVKEMLYSLLYRDIEGLYRSPGSYNSQIGVALSLIGIDKETKLAIIEAGISKPGEMERLHSMIQPDDVLITNFGTAHLENFPDQESLEAEKLILTEGAKIYRTPPEELYAELLSLAPFIDRANRQNLALAIAYIDDNYPEVFCKLPEYIPLVRPIEMRLEVKENARGKTLINDSYSNDLVSLEIALEAQARLGGRAIVLSPIEQSALSDDDLRQKVRELLNAYHTKKVYLLGWSIGQPTQGVVHIETSSIDELLALYKEELLAEHALLVKGARRYHLEQLIDQLSKRKHITRLEVNISTLLSNLAFYRSQLPQASALICMIKADAYGLGALEVARALESSPIASLAVAATDEGKALREAGIQKPIIVMNPELESLDTLTTYRLDAEVYSLDMLRHFGKRQKACGYPHIHLKVDSGMHRLGFRHNDLQAIVKLVNESQISITSVFSHLAAADDRSLDTFTHKQAEYLQDFYNKLVQGLWSTSHPNSSLPHLHLLNTAGIERFGKLYHLDGARLGIGLYGFSPCSCPEVHPVAQLKTRILQVKRIPKGEPIGYNCTIAFDDDRDIAVIPIGYADGLHRRYGNGRWAVSIQGQLCPIVGNICMDACMIDVSQTTANIGDEVIIFGDEHTPITKLAEVGQTIPYEILTSISPRVERVYLRE